MSDAELLKRLAEREGLSIRENGLGGMFIQRPLEAISDTNPVLKPWNPLTNWSDCGPLIEKYPIEINPWHEANCYVVMLWREDYEDIVSVVRHPDLKMAVALAVDAMGDE